MLRLTVALLAFLLAGTASAARWSDLRVDGTSEEAFAQSLAVFKDKLSPTRRYVFGEALKDIWARGAKDAEANQREYTAADYYGEVHGLTYDEVVKLTDPTGATALQRHRAGARMSAISRPRPSGQRALVARSPWPTQQSRPALGWGNTPESVAQQMQQCHCGAPNGPQGN